MYPLYGIYDAFSIHRLVISVFKVKQKVKRNLKKMSINFFPNFLDAVDVMYKKKKNLRISWDFVGNNSLYKGKSSYDILRNIYENDGWKINVTLTFTRLYRYLSILSHHRYLEHIHRHKLCLNFLVFFEVWDIHLGYFHSIFIIFQHDLDGFLVTQLKKVQLLREMKWRGS